MPSSSSIQEINIPMLTHIITIYNYGEAFVYCVCSMIIITSAWLIYILGYALFYLWDGTMHYCGRREVIVDDKDTVKCFYRYPICFKDTNNSPFNIYMEHYITSELEYYTDSYNTISIVLYGKCMEFSVGKKNIDKKVRSIGSIVQKSATIATKTVLKPNTSCWKLVMVGKKIRNGEILNPQPTNEWVDAKDEIDDKKEK